MEQPPRGDADDAPSSSTHEQRASGRREGKEPAVPQQTPPEEDPFYINLAETDDPIGSLKINLKKISREILRLATIKPMTQQIKDRAYELLHTSESLKGFLRDFEPRSHDEGAAGGSEDMHQRDMPTSSNLNAEGIHIEEVSHESWVMQVKKTLGYQPIMWQLSERVCIYRVLQLIKVSKPEDYVPMVVPLGPFHHKTSSELSRMDQHKLEAVSRMLRRLMIDESTLISEIAKFESEIRQCYEEPLEMDGETLSWMLAMDACFILEFFRMESNPECVSLVFQKASFNSTFSTILDDIIKLENQIPLFVLIRILQLECNSRKDAAISKLATMLSTNKVFHGFLFSSSWDGHAKSKLENYMMNERPPYHLLDLYRMVVKDLLLNSWASLELGGYEDALNTSDGFCGWSRNVSRLNSIGMLPRLSLTSYPYDTRSTPSAELLHKAGIKFQPGRLGFQKNWFGSTLSLPQIVITEDTEIMLRNLMAYEECQKCSLSPKETVISNFVRLLQDLIDSEKDVSLLRKSFVINSWIGSDEDAARIFNRLGDGITFDFIESFEMVMKAAREHYSSRWRVWWSQLVKDIFSQPWYILSFLTAVLILAMTAVQTVMTVIQTLYTMKS